MVCLFEKHVFLKHVSNWHCENFVISKPYVKCKVLKHKLLRIDTKSTTKLSFFFSIKCNDFSTVLEMYFEIHRGGTPRGEDFIYYGSMIQCTNVL